MINIKIPIPEKVTSNKIYDGSTHWTKRKKLADLYHLSTIEYRNNKITEYPIDISFIFSFKGRALDVDNCTFMVKMLIDSLRKWNIITDDSPEYIASITIYSQKGTKDEVEIIIT